MDGLELVDLWKTYGNEPALAGISLTVSAGQIVGFVGNNGAGKSTAMRIVLGITAPDSGDVRYDGEPVDAAIRKTIGYMPEERGLYPQMRVAEQLTFLGRLTGLPGAEAEEAAGRWMVRFGLGGAGRTKICDLSLGNQQRVQLAAALLHEPRLLILDEPFSGLDPGAVQMMSEVLREQAAEGKPVLFSSHQLDLVERLCDEVVIINRGRIVAAGPVTTLLETPTVQYRVRGDGVAPGWTRSLPGVHEVRRGDRASVVETGRDRVQELLALARSLGPVHEFAPVRPGLAAMYKDAVDTDAQG
ncbi:ATP-binding cassette domain-containing protein [Spirillospora sp. NBC_00431]